MFVSEPFSLVGAHRRRMPRFQHEMLVTVDLAPLFMRKSTPKQENDIFIFIRNLLYYGIGKKVPFQMLVAIGSVFSYGQRSIQQQNALFCPMLQIARSRHKN